ncbi:MAG: hypothetical protein JNJ77_10400 [Planctomycetia bacterium]|nr:hypothetical protein [Planctomycetia bacterium]
MNTAENSFDDRLTGALQKAVDQIKEQPVSKAAIRRMVDRIENWPEPMILKRRRQRRFWLATSLAASITLFIAWLAWPNDSWAEVVQAMQQKQWIRMSSTIGGYPSVNWISLPRGILAWRRGDAVYHDSKLKVIYRYDDSAKTIFRLPEDDESRKSLLATNRLFTDILQNKNELEGTIQRRLEVVHQERHDITSNGKKLTEYHLQCQMQDNKDQRVTMIFQVDPGTHLAQKLIIKNLTPRSKDEPNELQFQIDYPEQGPLDIYDLGFAKTIKLVDSYPNEGLAHIVDVIRQSRDNFDAYRGVFVRGNTPYVLIWRKESKWRIEMCKNFYMAKPPAQLEDPTAWWLDEAKKAEWMTVEVCDGKFVYTQDAQNHLLNERGIEKYKKQTFSASIDWDRGYARNYLPEIIGYPLPQIGTQIYTVEVKPHQEKGLEGTTLIHSRLSKTVSQSSARLQRYWVDPTRTYLVMRYDIGEWDDKNQPLLWRQVEKLNRSPSGIWYPEVVKGVGFVSGHFYLDFKAKLDNSLFEPKERKK